MYDLIKEAIVDDDAAIELSKMDKNVVEVVDAISELSLEDTMKLGMKFKRFPLGCDLTEAVVGTCASDLELMELLETAVYQICWDCLFIFAHMHLQILLKNMACAVSK